MVFWRKKKENEEVPDWIFESVVQYMRSPLWMHPILDFIDRNCVVFDTEEENKFSYTEIHMGFRDLIDQLLDAHCQELGISQEQFLEACRKSQKKGNLSLFFDHLVACEDFLIFKKMMVNRNIFLEQQVLKNIDEDSMKKAIEEEPMKEPSAPQESVAVPLPEVESQPEPENEEEKPDQPRQYTAEELEALEEQQLQAALKASQEEEMLYREEELALKEALELSMKDAKSCLEDKVHQQEQNDIELAIAISLAVEEERKRMAELLIKEDVQKESEIEAQAEKARLLEEAEKKKIEEIKRQADEEMAKRRLEIEKEKLELERKRLELEAKKLEMEQERKEMAALREQKAASLPPVRPPTVYEIRESLARDAGLSSPVKRKPSPPSTNQPSEKDILRRAAYLRQQRDRLVNQLASERSVEMKKFREDNKVEEAAPAAKPEHDAHAQAMRHALTRRLMKDMVTAAPVSDEKTRQKVAAQRESEQQARSSAFAQ